MNDKIQAGLLQRRLASSNSAKMICFAALAAILVAFIQPDSPLGKAATAAQTNPTPPCNEGLSPQLRTDIQNALLTGTEADVTAALNAAKAARGNRVGCYESCITYTTPDFTAPDLSTIIERWNTVHAPGLAAYANTCPKLGRVWGPASLGGYYAKLAGQTVDLTKLAGIADMYEAQQYKTAYAPSPLAAAAGIFGYLNVDQTDACYPLPTNPGIDPCTGLQTPPPSNVIAAFCALKPAICVTYTAGQFANRSFLIADTIPEQGKYDGGMAFDQGWAGVMMIEAKIRQADQSLKDKYESAARLAGDWAVSEPPVVNHNYTAKLTWLLAELYGWTGSPTYKAALLDKFNRSLKPGVLMDLNNDGLVDGMTNQPFSGLSAVAQAPGRMWDGHNALPTYQPMNAWAAVETYVALRDWGNTTAAQQVRPYAVALLDNVAHEVNSLGAPNRGSTQVPYALLLGLWKIAAYENDPHPNWENAAWAMWNYGIANSFGDNTANVGLYLLYRGNVPYVPLKQRREIYQPAATTVISGTLAGGNLAALYKDDNNFLSVLGNTSPSLSTDYHITQQALTKLRASVITKDSASAGIVRKLYLWNYATSAWAQVGAGAVSATESVLTATLTSGLGNYVSNGVVKVGVEHGGSGSHTMFVEKIELGVNE